MFEDLPLGAWLVVTPARDEERRLPRLARSLREQTSPLIGLWVVVDDGSTDGTASTVPDDLPFPTMVLRRANSGGLSAGSEFAAFFEGVRAGLEHLPGAERIMKLDADIELAPDHLAQLAATPVPGVIGGVIVSPGEREQLHTIRGALKAYSREAWEVVERLPPMLGLDVLDEVAIRQHGMSVEVVRSATATTNRATGTSEGSLAGRRRNGVMCRWTGYHPAVFALRIVRSLFRRPRLVGAVMLVVGYVTAGDSPFDAELRQAFRLEQRARLRALARHPVRWIRQSFGWD